MKNVEGRRMRNRNNRKKVSVVKAVVAILVLIAIFALGKCAGSADVITIKTPYCDLYYPAEFEDNVRIEEEENQDAYKVMFYACLDGYPEQKMFGIYFGGEQGDQIGKFEKGGNSVGVFVESFKSVGTEEWTEKERSQFASMQENINFVIDCLREKDGFSSVH